MSRRQDMKPLAQRARFAQKPRLAFYMHSMFGGGAERVFAEIASGFARRGYCVDLVMNRAEGPNLVHVDEAVNAVSLECSTATALPALTRYLKGTRPFILVSGLAHNNLIGAMAARMTGTPFAATVHDIPSMQQRELPARRVIGKFSQYVSPLVYRASDAIGVVSDAARRDIAYAGRRPDKFHILYNPIDTDHFSPRHRSGNRDTARLPDDDGSPVILGVGRLDRGKNFSALIEAARFVQDKMPMRLVILGEGPDRDRLQTLARTLGLGSRVYLPGFVTDPAPWYRLAAVHAVCSRSEGFGNTIIEAMATGTAVVISECAGGPRELLCDGAFGAIVPVETPRAMAEALMQAIESPPDPAALIARAAAFSLDACLDRYETMFEAASRARSSRPSRTGRD